MVQSLTDKSFENRSHWLSENTYFAADFGQVVPPQEAVCRAPLPPAIHPTGSHQQGKESRAPAEPLARVVERESEAGKVLALAALKDEQRPGLEKWTLQLELKK